MSIVIENQGLEDALARLAVQQTVPTRKRQLAELMLRMVVDRCAALDDPEAWARDVEQNDLEAGLLRGVRGLRDTLRSGERIEDAYTVRKVARTSDESDKGESA